MHLSCGVDVVELDSFAHSVELGGLAFLQRIYTAEELSYCRNRMPQLAARLAAKEAFVKALGTGIRGVQWREIEVRRLKSGKPYLHLSGAASTQSADLRIAHMALSLSHSEHFALAFVVIEMKEPAAQLRQTGDIA